MERSNGGHEKLDLKKGPWTRDEDQKLLAYIEEHGHGSWRALPAKAGLQRCGKSCRLRWTNYLRPDIKRGKFSSQEEKAIIRLHALLGNRWSAIAAHLPKRTDNEIKNYWNTRLKKRLTRMGIDPVTHKPKDNPAGSAQSKQAAVVSHKAQWETARLEAETRLVRESKLLSRLQLLHKTTSLPAPQPPQPRAPLCLDVLKVWQATVAQNSFFGSPGCVDSPTSTLTFSANSSSAGGGRQLTENVAAVHTSTSAAECLVAGKVNGYMQDKDKFDNSVLLLHGNSTVFPMDQGSMDLTMISSDCFSNSMKGNGCMQDKGKFDNSLLLLHDNSSMFPMDQGSMDSSLISSDCFSNSMASNYAREFEDIKNYWNDLVNLFNLI